MTNNEIMALVRRGYRELGLRPGTGKMRRINGGACPIGAALAALDFERHWDQREAAGMLGKSPEWVDAVTAGFDGVVLPERRIAEYPEFQDGYAFGLQARREFLPVTAA